MTCQAYEEKRQCVREASHIDFTHKQRQLYGVFLGGGVAAVGEVSLTRLGKIQYFC